MRLSTVAFMLHYFAAASALRLYLEQNAICDAKYGRFWNLFSGQGLNVIFAVFTCVTELR